MTLTENARKVYDNVPLGGSISGGKLRDRTRMGAEDFRRAKKELKNAGLVTLGRGRGGSVTRIEGVEPEPEPVTATPEERMAVAREAKKEKSREQQHNEAVRTYLAKRLGAELKVNPEKINVLYGANIDPVYVEVWDDDGAAVVGRINEDVVEEAVLKA